jgi:SHS2 domain-containing protein
MTGSFDYFEVEADVGIVGRGPTPAEAFAQTALGVFALMVDLASVEEREVREVRAHGSTRETLLVNWINECLYLHDIEGFVACRIEFAVLDLAPDAGGEAQRLHSFLHGEEVDPGRHRLGTVVKAATLHQATVGEAGDGFEARLIVDI